MYKPLLLLVWVALQANSLAAQQKRGSYRKKWEWQVGTGIGTNLPVTKLFKGRPTDFLVDYNEKGVQYQFYTLGVFFHPRWGIDFSFGGGHKPTINRRDRFTEAMQQAYPDRYYIDAGTQYGINKFNNTGVIRAMVGVTYRWEKDHWLFYPKLSLGSTTFFLKDQLSYLKEKGNNRYQELLFRSSGYIDPDPFTVGLSAVAGYRINRWLLVKAELQSTYFRPNFSFEKTIRDLDTKSVVSSETIRYKESVLTFTPQIGLALCFKPNPNPKSSGKPFKQQQKKKKRSGVVPL